MKMNNLDSLSQENLERIREVIKIVRDELELSGLNRLAGLVSIPLRRFREKGLDYDDLRPILYKVGVRVISRDDELAKISYPLAELDSVLLLRVNDLGPELEKLREIKKAIDEKLKEKDDRVNVEFDSQNRVVSYGSKTYTIRSHTRLALFEKLWDERREVMAGTDTPLQKGERFPKNSLATHIGLIESNKEFSKQVKERLENDIKGLSRAFRKKKFPLHIGTANGVLLTVEVSKK